jgi:CHRD domain
MRLRYLVMLAAAGLLAIFAVPSLAAIQKAELTANLSGKKEIPGPGDRDGRGEGEFKVNVKKGKFKYFVEYEDIEEAEAGHIHKGDKANAGPIKIELFTESTPSPAEGVVKDVRKQLLRKIAKNPKDWYVNLHNADFPDGAIRGQLKLEKSQND